VRASDWVEWKGGDCPVEPGVWVEYKTRSGFQFEKQGGELVWGHRIMDADIIAYRVADRQTTVETSSIHANDTEHKYREYFKDVSGLDSIDTYELNRLFPVVDDTGAILHARKKLLLAGSRTGGKSMRKDIKEARDTLTRWLEMTEKEGEV
jgi:hypothetical protein